MSTRFARIEPTPECPEPQPTTSGNWIQEPDGGLIPADEATARTAGLLIDDATDDEPPR